jgi:hypothetical protein
MDYVIGITLFQIWPVGVPWLFFFDIAGAMLVGCLPSARHAHWTRVRDALAGLRVVGGEAEVTYPHLVGCLQTVAETQTAPTR